MDTPVVNVDRKFFTQIVDRKLFTRFFERRLFSRIAVHRLFSRINLPAAGAAAGFALLVGLSAPAAALTDAGSASADGANAGSPTVAAAAAEAVTNAVAPPIAPPAAPAPAFPVAGIAAPGPSAEQLHPVAAAGAQQEFTPTVEQMNNAKAIVATGQAMGLPPRAWIIAVATSLQETNLKNLGHLGDRNDHDSQGLFQQRPSSGWGTPEQITNPTYAATAFYNGLVKVPGWERMPLTDAAQKVQVSAYPDHYAKHETQAEHMIIGLYGIGPFADVAAGLK